VPVGTFNNAPNPHIWSARVPAGINRTEEPNKDIPHSTSHVPHIAVASSPENASIFLPDIFATSLLSQAPASAFGGLPYLVFVLCNGFAVSAGRHPSGPPFIRGSTVTVRESILLSFYALLFHRALGEGVPTTTTSLTNQTFFVFFLPNRLHRVG
jgi:hypothetical protein